MSILIGQKLVENAKIEKLTETFWVIFKQCDNVSSTDFVHFFWWIWWHIKEVFFLNDITTKYIIATDLVLRPRSSIHESEFIKRLLLMSLSNEAVHQPQQHSAVGIHLKSFLMKLMNWQPNEKSLSQISKSPHAQWEKIKLMWLRFESHLRQNVLSDKNAIF